MIRFFLRFLFLCCVGFLYYSFFSDFSYFFLVLLLLLSLCLSLARSFLYLFSIPKKFVAILVYSVSLMCGFFVFYDYFLFSISFFEMSFVVFFLVFLFASVLLNYFFFDDVSVETQQ